MKNFFLNILILSISFSFVNFASSDEIDPIEMSMAFALSKNEINVIIIGSKSLNHVEENLNYMKKNLDSYKNLINQYENVYEKLDNNWRQLT